MATSPDTSGNEALMGFQPILLSEEGQRRFQQLIEQPPAPTESLKALMRLQDFPVLTQ